MKEEKRKIGKVISLKISNIDLASTILLTKGLSPSFSSSINSILLPTIEEFRKEGFIPFLSEEEALGIIETYAREKSITVAGRDVFSKRKERRSEISYARETIAITNRELSPPSTFEGEDRTSNSFVPLPSTTNERNEGEIEKAFNSEVENLVEEIKLEEETSLLSKILIRAKEEN